MTRTPSLEPGEQTAKEWWNSWSDTFQDAYAEADDEVAIAFGSGVPVGDDLGLLGDMEGISVVELGCGGAQFGLALAKRGADVTGVDISSEQLSHARTLADERGLELDLIETSVTDLEMLDDGAFELAVSAFAFQWVPNLRACFEEAHRVLEPGGRLVFSVDHPLYRRLDPETGDLAVSYFDETPRREYSEEFDAELVVYRRTVGDIVTAVLDAGFALEALREPGYEDPAAYESTFGSFEPEYMAEIPPALVVAARK